MSVLTRRIKRPSASLVVASVALFAALGGTGYAAAKVTGSMIANSTITGTDVKNKSLGPKEIKPDSLTGDQVDESALGAVPEALHALNADNAQTAVKAADADKVGGIAPADLMLNKPRAYESTIPAANNFPNDSTLGTLPNLPAGTYLVMARLNYHNPGAAGVESCTLDVPGANDASWCAVGAGISETVSLQEIVTTGSVFMPSVSCTSDGSDDTDTGSIIAVRLD